MWTLLYIHVIGEYILEKSTPLGINGVGRIPVG